MASAARSRPAGSNAGWARTASSRRRRPCRSASEALGTGRTGYQSSVRSPLSGPRSRARPRTKSSSGAYRSGGATSPRRSSASVRCSSRSVSSYSRCRMSERVRRATSASGALACSSHLASCALSVLATIRFQTGRIESTAGDWPDRIGRIAESTPRDRSTDCAAVAHGRHRTPASSRICRRARVPLMARSRPRLFESCRGSAGCVRAPARLPAPPPRRPPSHPRPAPGRSGRSTARPSDGTRASRG